MTILEEPIRDVVPTARPASLTDPLGVALRRLDRESARATYWEQDELVVLDSVLPGPLLDAMVQEAESLEEHVQRRRMPFYKKSGSISHFRLRELAPRLVDIYRSSHLISFLGEIVGAPLLLCPDEDPHACALYWYSKPGDRVGFHYDRSHYEGHRYTVLIGLVDDSTSRLVCNVRTGHGQNRPTEMRVATTPGRMVVFNGSKLHHSVSPLGPGQRRIVLSLEYVTSTRMTRLRRFVSNVKDAMAYFGFREVFGARPAPASRSAIGHEPSTFERGNRKAHFGAARP